MTCQITEGTDVDTPLASLGTPRQIVGLQGLHIRTRSVCRLRACSLNRGRRFSVRGLVGSCSLEALHFACYGE